MRKEEVTQESSNQPDISDRIRREESVRERIDQKGTKWKKVYFAGGAHFRNWQSQCIEIYGEHNIEIEDIDSTVFKCFEESGDKLYRIWVREGDETKEFV
jgi:hypothetical protein